jgi:N-acetyl-anhydromuramyl-L-alanine amidase AmpD
MKYIVESGIRLKYHKGFKRNIKKIDTAIIHGTAGGGDIIKWMLEGGYMGKDKNGKRIYRAEQYKKGIALFHFIINKKGEIFEIINPDRWVYHSSTGRHDKRTIGIELINNDRTNRDEYTTEQYCAILDLIFEELCKKYPIKRIAGHGVFKQKYGRGTKRCPGNFNWKWLETVLDTYEYDFTLEDGIYEFKKR